MDKIISEVKIDYTQFKDDDFKNLAVLKCLNDSWQEKKD